MSLPQAKSNIRLDAALKAEADLTNGPPLKTIGQEVAVIIVVAPHGTPQRNVEFGMMILGTFPDLNAAKEHIRKLNAMGFDSFHLYIVPLYVLFPLPPPEKIEDTNYFEEELQQIVDGYKKHAEYSAQAMKMRIEEDRAAEQKAREEKKMENAPEPLQLEDGRAPLPDGKRYATEEEHNRIRVMMGAPIPATDLPADAVVLKKDD